MVKYVVVVTVLLAGAVGAWAFQPWRAFTSSTVDEALPTAATALDEEDVASTDVPVEPVDEVEATGPGGAGTKPTPRPSPQPKPEVVELAAGDFVAAEHATSGRARIIELADGSRFVRLEGLDSSDGPDLVVALSASPSGGDWGSYDDGRYVGLGDLKATNGNQNYAIPPGVDLAGLQSVVIWCDRFNVAFGTAAVAL